MESIRRLIALYLVNLAFRIWPPLAGDIGMHNIQFADKLRAAMKDRAGASIQ